MSNQSSNRKQYLDIAKGIGIILVVLGHCPQVYNPLKQWIYAFHMPLFFFVSGMVWNKLSHENRGFLNKAFLIDKIKRLIVPCYIWGVIYMILNVITCKEFSPISIFYLLYGSQSGFSHAGSLTSLWFLPCMFLAVCTFELIQMTAGRKNNKLVLFAFSIVFAATGVFLPHISGGYPWCIDVMFLAVAFMLWGYLGKEYIERKNKPSVSIVIASGAMLLLTLTFQLNLPYVSINNVDMAGRFLGNPVLYFVDAVAGSAAVILISYAAGASRLHFSGVAYLGRITIPIFILHKPIVQLLDLLCRTLNISAVVVVIVSLFTSICVSMIIYRAAVYVIPIAFGEEFSRKNFSNDEESSRQ